KPLPHPRHETGGRNDAQFWMAHANKGFRAAQIKRLAADLGLVSSQPAPSALAISSAAARGSALPAAVPVSRRSAIEVIDPGLWLCASEANDQERHSRPD